MATPSIQRLQAAMTQLGRKRGAHVLAWLGGATRSKLIDHDDLPVIDAALGGQSRHRAIDVVLHCEGGNVAAAARIGHLLRARCRRLRVLVPAKARSAATVLCLAADEIVFGELAVLSPIDPSVRGVARAGEAAVSVSSEDVRALAQVAREWFGIRSDQAMAAVLSRVCDAVFPPSLGGLYRSDAYVRKVGCELLATHHRPLPASRRRRIVDTLIGGFQQHTHSLCRSEIAAMGLRARPCTTDEAPALQELLAAADELLGHLSAPPAREARGVIGSPGFVAGYFVEGKAGRPSSPAFAGWRHVG